MRTTSPVGEMLVGSAPAAERCGRGMAMGQTGASAQHAGEFMEEPARGAMNNAAKARNTIIHCAKELQAL